MVNALPGNAKVACLANVEASICRLRPVELSVGSPTSVAACLHICKFCVRDSYVTKRIRCMRSILADDMSRPITIYSHKRRLNGPCQSTVEAEQGNGS